MPYLPLLPTEELDYTQLTRTGMLLRLQRNFTQLNPSWEDYSVAYPENLLLEGQATMIDLIRGAMEGRVREVYPATMTQRLSAIRLGRTNGFQLTSGTPATVTLSFALRGGGTHGKDIELPAGLKIRSTDPSNPKKYRLTAAGTLASGNTSVDVGAENAELVQETHQSDEGPNQILILQRAPLIDDSVEVTAANGDYAAYTSFSGVGASVRGFVVSVDDEGRGRITFGSGIQGKIPQGTITVSYKVGGGIAGEVEAGTKWIIEDTVTDIDGQAVSLVCTNAAASQPGTDPMTVAEARVRIPLEAHAVRSATIDSDFVTIATKVAGCDRAMLLTSNEDTSLAENYARLLCVGRGEKNASGTFAAVAPSQAVLDQIAALIVKGGQYPPRQGLRLDVEAAPLRTVDIAVKLYKQSNREAVDVAANVRNALADFFAVTLAKGQTNDKVNFGAYLLGADGDPDYRIAWSHIFKAINNADGVREVSYDVDGLLVEGARSSLFLRASEFPVLGTVTIYDLDQSGAEI